MTGLILAALLSGQRAASTGLRSTPADQPLHARAAAAPACLGARGCDQPCFGAAARDPLHQPCRNPKLTFRVTPSPSDAQLEFGERCTIKERSPNWTVCALGPLPATDTFALIGDSHAQHWAPALADVAYTRDWRGLSITRASCPLSTSVPDLPAPLGAQCVRWNHRVDRFLEAHPEVDIVFVSVHAGAGVLVRRGQSALAAKVTGYTAAWARLPPSVKHIVVIRDTPLDRNDSLACIQRAIARHRRAGLTCAVARRHAEIPDPEVIAARTLPPGRVQVVDLTPLLCGTRQCYPVIGGVLVHRDIDHLTAEFSATLGPFLLRALDGLMASWAPSPSPAALNRPG